MIRRSVALRSMAWRPMACLGLVAALLLSGCASDDWEGRYNELHTDMFDMAAERDGARQDLVEAYAEQERLQAQKAQAERALAEEQLATEEATQRALAYAEQLERMKSQPAQLPETPSRVVMEDVLERFRTRNIDASINVDGDFEIRIPADVTFRSGEADLTKAGKAAIRRIAPELTGEFAEYDIRVEGHTDNEPLVRTRKKWGDNRGLGSARANAVTRYLESEFRIASARIKSQSLGSTAPLAPNTSKANKAKNRRVAIVVVMPRDAAMGK